MSDVLVRIKRLVLKGRFEFSKKARAEMEIVMIKISICNERNCFD